jgi:hypothetical protein
MSESAYVDQAATWAKRLTQTEARGPGDMENAWRRLEARYGVSWRTFWALRYRKPREITAFLFDQLKAAHAAECERQERLFKHEREITAAISGPDSVLVRAASALAGEDSEG